MMLDETSQRYVKPGRFKPPPTMCVLYILGPNGGLVGFYYHPNRDAMQPKIDEVRRINPTWRCELVEYETKGASDGV